MFLLFFKDYSFRFRVNNYVTIIQISESDEESKQKRLNSDLHFIEKIVYKGLN
jgi:hypothetical protein